MFGYKIPTPNASGMDIRINDVPAGTISSGKWESLTAKVRSDKRLKLLQAWMLFTGIVETAMKSIGAGLACFGAFLVLAIILEPATINQALAEGFATKMHFILQFIIMATIAVFVMSVLCSSKLRRDPVEDAFWHSVRVELNVHAVGNVQAKPVNPAKALAKVSVATVN